MIFKLSFFVVSKTEFVVFLYKFVFSSVIFEKNVTQSSARHFCVRNTFERMLWVVLTTEFTNLKSNCLPEPHNAQTHQVKVKWPSPQSTPTLCYISES